MAAARHDPDRAGPWEPEKLVTAKERAASLRDEAKAMDPAGTSDARVQGARQAVDKGLGRDAGREDDKRGPKEPK